MDVTIELYRDGAHTDEEAPLARIGDLVAQDGVFVWVHLPEPDPGVLNQLSGALGLHHLAVEDALHAHQRPKIERYDSFSYLVVYTAAMTAGRLRLHEISCFVAPRFAVTVGHATVDDLSAFRSRLDRAQGLLTLGGAFFAYALLDHVVDDYFVAVDALADHIAKLEETLVYRSSTGTGLETAFTARRDVTYFRRTVAPLREVLNVLLRRDEQLLARELEVYVRDLYDHVVRVAEDLDTFHDLISGALDAHLAVVSNAMSEVVLKVSAWAAIIALPTVIASIYGMNFLHMPELNWLYGYPYALALMLASSFALWAYFKRRHWI